MTKIRLGISSCLLGNPVRYDGMHKLDHFLADTLSQYVDYVPVCPEVECGLPVPREAMRLVGDPVSPRLMTRQTGRDLTDQMLAWTDGRLAELEKEGLQGFIFKAKSPSSGMQGVKIYDAKGNMSGRGAGLFAAAFMNRFPLLPVEDEGRLQDPDLRENFIERIFALHRYREATGDKPTVNALMNFHASHKLLLMAHSEVHTRRMGKTLAGLKSATRAAVQDYEQNLLAALKVLATPDKHVNVLQHMLGYFKKLITSAEKAETLELIAAFKESMVPLIVPVTLINHFVRKYAVTYLEEQVYLNPHPLELKLRNHA